MSNINIDIFSSLIFKCLSSIYNSAPESIISSTIIQFLFFTFPTIFITSDFPGKGLLLSIIAIFEFILLLNALVLSTPPTSGATQIILLIFIFFLICLQKVELKISCPLECQRILEFVLRVNQHLRFYLHQH